MPHASKFKFYFIIRILTQFRQNKVVLIPSNKSLFSNIHFYGCWIKYEKSYYSMRESQEIPMELVETGWRRPISTFLQKYVTRKAFYLGTSKVGF